LDQAPVEVTIREARHDVGSYEFRAADTLSIPGTFGDPLRAVEAMPGVAATLSGLPYFYVRGAPPADTGYFIDGIAVPLLFHLGPGPSVIPPGLVDHAEFFPGAAPAHYGRFAGGTIAAETKAPRDQAHGQAGAKLFDSNLLLEAPFADGHSTALVAGRYGYPNLLLSAFAPTLSLQYWDYSTRITHALGDTDVLSVFVFGARDHLQDEAQRLEPIDTQFHRADIRYDHRWHGGSFRIATTYGYDRTAQAGVETDSTEIVKATSTRVRTELRQRLSSTLDARAGGDFEVSRHQDEIGTRGVSSSSFPSTQAVAGAHFDMPIATDGRSVIIPGVRIDVYRSSDATVVGVDPRLAARLGITSTVSSMTNLGVSHQIPSTFVLPVPGARLDLSRDLQTTYQIAQGIELWMMRDMSASLSGFYYIHRRMSDYASACVTLAAQCSALERVDGRTYGLEVLVQRSLSRQLGGWLAYTFSRAERQLGNVTYLSSFDRTHVLSAVLSYRVSDGYRLGLRGVYYSGRPEVQKITFFGGATASGPLPWEAPQHRLPGFYRLDARAERRWAIGETAWITVLLEFFNATLTKEAIDYRCDRATGDCTATTVGPIALPSIGVEGGF